MKKIIAFVLAFLPATAFAQQSINDINGVATKVTSIGNLIIELAISLAVVWIVVSVVMYLIAGGDPEKRKEGGLRILWGVVGLVVITGIWGLVYIVKHSFVTNDQNPINSTTQSLLPTPPTVQ